jgi:hypothetical protein
MLTRFLKVALVGLTLVGAVVASIVAPKEIINTVNTHPTATWVAVNLNGLIYLFQKQKD